MPAWGMCRLGTVFPLLSRESRASGASVTLELCSASVFPRRGWREVVEKALELVKRFVQGL